MAETATLTRALAAGFIRTYPEEAAQLVESWKPEASVTIVRQASPADGARLVERLAPDAAAAILVRLEAGATRRLLRHLDPARAAVVLAQLDAGARDTLLALMAPRDADETRGLLSYPPDTAGRLMDVRVPTVRAERTAGETLARLRRQPHQRGADVIVVDVEDRLVGTIPIEDVALAPPRTRLQELIRREPVMVDALAAREDVVERLSRLELATLPVVDADGRVLGVIQHEALARAANEEASADIQTMVGASKQERALSPIGFAVRRRLPWLEVNLATAFLAASVVGLFEGLISQFTALAVLLPLVAGQSGNTGAQALAVTMRGLVLREVRLRHWYRISVKEAAVAFLNGLAIALTTSAAVYLWSRSVGLALIIAASMLISMVVAGLAGAAVPMGLVALRQDPAQASSIILTTVTDVVGFFSFLGIATLLVGML